MNYTKKQTHKFQPGRCAYREFLDKLTPEEYAAHLEERRKRKSMRKAMEQVQSEYQDIWISQLHNAAYRCLQKALEHGDPVAFAAVWDRVVGKSHQSIDINKLDNKPLPFSDDMLGN